jgi:hypothetical protein
MQYDWIDLGEAKRRREREACVRLIGVLCATLWALLWVGVCHVRNALRAEASSYPAPVCESCGAELDGRHPTCWAGETRTNDLDYGKSAAVFMARGGTGEP